MQAEMRTNSSRLARALRALSGSDGSAGRAAFGGGPAGAIHASGEPDQERIHTETCAKYDLHRVERILASAGFAQTYVDSAGLFAVHLARLEARA